MSLISDNMFVASSAQLRYGSCYVSVVAIASEWQCRGDSATHEQMEPNDHVQMITTST